MFKTFDGCIVVCTLLSDQFGLITRRLPRTMERMGLPLELPRFGCTPSDQRRRCTAPNAEQRRIANDHPVVQLNQRLQIAVAQRSNVVDTTDQNGRNKGIACQAVFLIPQCLQSHRPQITPSRMATDGNAFGIAAIGRNITHHPRCRRSGLARDFVNGDLGAQ